MSVRAAIYARISSDPTGGEAGVGRQQEDAIALCERRGWEIVGTFVDNDASASKYSKKSRPAYKNLIEAIELGQVDAVAAYHTDRLYRQPKELEHLIDLVEAKGLLVGTCEGDFDLATSDGCAYARMMVAMAAKSSDDKSRRVKRAKKAQAEKGAYGGGKRPFGYERDGVTIRPVEADLIRQAAARVIAGESTMAICREWDQQGIPTVMGGRWRPTTLNRMLIQPRLIGKRTHRGVLSDAVWPAILDEGTQTRLRSILTDAKRNTVGGVRARRYLLTGLVFCADCKVKMHPHAGRYQCEKDYRGGCNKCGISAPRLDADITAAVLELGESKKVRRQLTTRTSHNDEARLLRDIDEAQAELDLLAADLEHKRIGRVGYIAAAGAIERRLETLNLALSRHLREASALTLITAPTEPWDEMGLDRQRLAVAALVERIYITPASKAAGRYDASRAEVIWR